VILTLEITAPHADQLGADSRKTFRANGGVIGRDTRCDWVLPHTKVSSTHARVTCEGAVFYIEDTSRNGVFLNSTSHRLAKGRRHALKAGDRLLIDPYEILVSITSDPADSVRSNNQASGRGRPAEPAPDAYHPFERDDERFGPGYRPSPPPSRDPRHDVLSESMPHEELDPLKLLDPVPNRQSPRKAPNASDLERSSPLAAHYKPPVVRPPVAVPRPSPPPTPPSGGNVVIPEDYDPLAPDPAPSAAWPSPPAAAASLVTEPRAQESELAAPEPGLAPEDPFGAVVSLPTPGSAASEPEGLAAPSRNIPVPAAPAEGGLAEVLAGAGLDRADVTPELAASFGEILRVVVSGVMDVLRARHDIKDEFRMRVTHFKPADNNPLKFSANVDDALHNLLVKRNKAYLGPVEAFDDAFEDLRHHQMALLAGMRLAFESMLKEFDPDHLQAQFDRTVKKSSLIGMPGKLRYWELYRDKWQEMARDSEGTFRKLFGEAFAKAYDEQLRLLKNGQRRNG
jgi:type VI secretion system FHA domain protein